MGYSQLAAALRSPIQIGENFYGPRDLHDAPCLKACDYVMPDFMRIGGVTGWLRAAAIAGTASVPISTHLYPEVAAHPRGGRGLSRIHGGAGVPC